MNNILVFADPGLDLDDEHTFLLMSHLHKQKTVNVLGVVANLSPARERAAIARGTLDLLGLNDVPVGVGTEVTPRKINKYEKVSYASYENLYDGKQLAIDQLNKSDDKSVTIVCQSGLTDFSDLVRTHEDLVVRKVKNVAIMGGVQSENDEVLMTGNYFQPDSANNVTFDWSSGVWLYAKLQELGIPMIVTTRNAAYAAQIPFSTYDKLEETGSVIGSGLKGRQKPSLEGLWKAAISPPDSEIRGTLPNDRDRAWFIKTFCNDVDPGSDVDSIWSHVDKFNLYDPINFIASIDTLRNQFFSPTVVKVNNVEHLIVGVSPTNTNIIDPQKLVNFLIDTEVESLK